MILTELHDEITAINLSLLKDKETKYFGYFSLMCNYESNNEIPLIGVRIEGKDLYIAINTDEWDKYDINVKKEVIKHEILHISFGHLFCGNSKRYLNCDNSILQIAMDLEINQYLNKEYLPEWGIFIEDYQKSYPDLNWKPFAGSYYYYNLLKDNNIMSPPMQHNWSISDSDNEDKSENSDTNTGIPTDELLDTTLQELVINNMIDKSMSTVDENSVLYGILNGKINTVQDLVLEKVKVSLKEYMNNLLNNSSKLSGKKMVKRKPLANPSALSSLVNNIKQKVFVAIDESGSVSENELNQFVSILSELSKKFEIELRPFDTEVGDKKKYRRNQATYERTYCGGTDLNCVFDYYNSRKDMTMLFILTDGHVPKITVKCNKPYVIFISNNGTTRNVTGFKHKKLNSEMMLC
mgnify:FL=1